MTVRIRGIRTGLQAGSVPARLATQGGPGPAVDTTIPQLAAALVATGMFGLPGGAAAPGSGYITSVDSNFKVTAGALSLHTIADGDVLANISGGTLEPSANTITAILDHVFGSTEGNILQRGASAWQVLAPGTVGQVLTSQGAAALNHWAAASGSTISDGGAWNSTAGYTVGQVVQWLSSTYLNYVAVAAAVAGPAQWGSDKSNVNETTTVSTHDTATSTGAGYVLTQNNGQSSGKWYFEFKVSNLLDNNFAIGVGTAGFAAFIGGSALGQFLDNFSGGSSGGSWAGLAAGARGAVALDLTHDTFFITNDVTAGSIAWNGSTSNNPATNTGGYPLGSSPLTPVFQLMYVPSSAGQVCQLFNGSGTTIIPAIPTGFSLWGAGAVSNIAPDLDTAHWQGQGNQNPANLNEHALLGGV